MITFLGHIGSLIPKKSLLFMVIHYRNMRVYRFNFPANQFRTKATTSNAKDTLPVYFLRAISIVSHLRTAGLVAKLHSIVNHLQNFRSRPDSLDN